MVNAFIGNLPDPAKESPAGQPAGTSQVQRLMQKTSVHTLNVLTATPPPPSGGGAAIGGASGGSATPGGGGGAEGRVVPDALDQFASTIDNAAATIEASRDQFHGVLNAQQSANEWDDPNFVEFVELVKRLEQQISQIADTRLRLMAHELRDTASKARLISTRR
jgi:uncharacterized protein YukE